MTILQFTLSQHPSQGGIYVTTQSFREVLNSKIVEIISPELQGQTTGDYQIRVFDRGLFKRYPIPINKNEIMSRLSSSAVSLVIIHGLWRIHDNLGYQFAKKNNIPFWIVTHGALDPYVFTYRALPKHLWMSLFGERLIREASAVICSTSREYDKAKKYLKDAKIEVCHWGIEPPNLKQVNSWKAEIRDRLNIPLGQQILLFLGRIDRMKRPIETALAFKQLKPNNWTFLIVGAMETGEGAEEILEICDGQLVQYHPPVYGVDKWKFLAAADAFVNLSHRENFGRSVVEAAAVGLPLLISDGVDIFPVLQSAGAANVVTINSLDDIRTALQIFLQKLPLEQKYMGQKAQKCFQENFTKELFRNELIKLVKKSTSEGLSRCV